MKQAGIISVNEARSWLAALNIDMSDIEYGDEIPEIAMNQLELEEMEINNENLQNPPEETVDSTEVEASADSTFPDIKPGDYKKEVVPVDSVQRVNADDMTEPGVDGENVPDQLMYPGLTKKKKEYK